MTRATASAPRPLRAPSASPAVLQELRAFTWQGRPTTRALTSVGLAKRPIVVETLVNEFWTSKQRVANSLHEVSYRACFKPQLPRFFIDRFTASDKFNESSRAATSSTVGGESLGSASITLNGLMSQPTGVRPASAASTAVVPRPLKGS